MSKMISHDPNGIFVTLFFLVTGTYFQLMNFVVEHADLSMKVILFILGVVSYSISIYQSLKKKK